MLGAIRGPVTVVDSTLATPLLQQPLAHGVDLVVHSATKALSGHNDATIGIVTGNKTLVNEVWAQSVLLGTSASAFDAWNGVRSLKTLGIRVRQHCEVAAAIARLLDTDDRVERVHYPTLEGHPQHDLAIKQMTAGGGCVTFDLVGGYPAARRFVESLTLARLAPSLGGPDTLVNHPASMTHASRSLEERAAVGIGDGQIRFSAGLAHEDDVTADVVNALELS